MASDPSETAAAADYVVNVLQLANGDNWYADMRGASIHIGKADTLDSLTQQLAFCRKHLEEKKFEWVAEARTKSRSQLGRAIFQDMQLVRANLENCKSALIAMCVRVDSIGPDVEIPSETYARINGLLVQQERVASGFDALRNMDWHVRDSYNIFTQNQVLILLNKNGSSISFVLRCIKSNGAHRDFSQSIAGNGSIEMGDQQGWDGNWATDERFEIWTSDVRFLVWGEKRPKAIMRCAVRGIPVWSLWQYRPIEKHEASSAVRGGGVGGVGTGTGSVWRARLYTPDGWNLEPGADGVPDYWRANGSGGESGRGGV